MFYDELMQATDPAKVGFEMDCGWVAVGGKNPADYLTRYATRISMLHVKDLAVVRLIIVEFSKRRRGLTLSMRL